MPRSGMRCGLPATMAVPKSDDPRPVVRLPAASAQRSRPASAGLFCSGPCLASRPLARLGRLVLVSSHAVSGTWPLPDSPNWTVPPSLQDAVWSMAAKETKKTGACTCNLTADTPKELQLSYHNGYIW